MTNKEKLALALKYLTLITTFIFFMLKLTYVLNCSWFLILILSFSPYIVALSLGLILFSVCVVLELIEKRMR